MGRAVGLFIVVSANVLLRCPFGACSGGSPEPSCVVTPSFQTGPSGSTQGDILYSRPLRAKRMLYSQFYVRAVDSPQSAGERALHVLFLLQVAPGQAPGGLFRRASVPSDS